ncbi:MAG: hypothetical protein WD709_06805 [Gammaproteobacteria bacterium]
MNRTGTSMFTIILNCIGAGICAGIFFSIILVALVLFIVGNADLAHNRLQQGPADQALPVKINPDRDQGPEKADRAQNQPWQSI